MMSLLLGFDPGGEDGFGWCVAEDKTTLPLRVRETGVVDNAQRAISGAMAHIRQGEEIIAVGIDAPLFWVATGDRIVDKILREAVKNQKARSPGGTVQAVNSLRGACLVQGILTAVQLRESHPHLLITESHPKAILWLLKIANTNHHPAGVSLPSMSAFLIPPPKQTTDHERDAAIATLSAWAMVYKPQDWQDLYPEEHPVYSPIAAPLGYWIPRITDRQTT